LVERGKIDEGANLRRRRTYSDHRDSFKGRPLPRTNVVLPNPDPEGGVFTSEPGNLSPSEVTGVGPVTVKRSRTVPSRQSGLLGGESAGAGKLIKRGGRRSPGPQPREGPNEAMAANAYSGRASPSRPVPMAALPSNTPYSPPRVTAGHFNLKRPPNEAP